MITTVMNQKRGLRFSKLPDDGDPWAPSNLVKVRSKRETPVKPRWAEQQTRSSGPNQLK